MVVLVTCICTALNNLLCFAMSRLSENYQFCDFSFYGAIDCFTARSCQDWRGPLSWLLSAFTSATESGKWSGDDT
ncbi:hypothetical protein KC19_6G066700 [Ceratodon purpureus]|uniref:Secreted protein n=1 Tax=Ceratodon purpureus TaxID=3225 RepID=A0A8T0HEP4_CERPU|nr:hypothetical protein KC19_6G066700 [Ceratodon purpureus]